MLVLRAQLEYKDYAGNLFNCTQFLSTAHSVYTLML